MHIISLLFLSFACARASLSAYASLSLDLGPIWRTFTPLPSGRGAARESVHAAVDRQGGLSSCH